MELKDFSVLFSLETLCNRADWCDFARINSHFSHFCDGKKRGISLYWARLKLRENTPFVVELLASGASKWAEKNSKVKPIILCIRDANLSREI